MAITREERAARKRERERLEHARAMDLHWQQRAVSCLARGDAPEFERRVTLQHGAERAEISEVWIRAYGLTSTDGGVVVVGEGFVGERVFFSAYGAERWAHGVTSRPYLTNTDDHALRDAASALYAAIVAANTPKV